MTIFDWLRKMLKINSVMMDDLESMKLQGRLPSCDRVKNRHIWWLQIYKNLHKIKKFPWILVIQQQESWFKHYFE